VIVGQRGRVKATFNFEQWLLFCYDEPLSPFISTQPNRQSK
jgi:hypothetical protein